MVIRSSRSMTRAWLRLTMKQRAARMGKMPTLNMSRTLIIIAD
jgi:hypothetical protein